MEKIISPLTLRIIVSYINEDSMKILSVCFSFISMLKFAYPPEPYRLLYPR